MKFVLLLSLMGSLVAYAVQGSAYRFAACDMVQRSSLLQERYSYRKGSLMIIFELFVSYFLVGQGAEVAADLIMVLVLSISKEI